MEKFMTNRCQQSGLVSRRLSQCLLTNRRRKHVIKLQKQHFVEYKHVFDFKYDDVVKVEVDFKVADELAAFIEVVDVKELINDV